MKMKILTISLLFGIVGVILPLILLAVSTLAYHIGVQLPPSLDHVLFVTKVVIWPGGFPFMMMTDGVPSSAPAYYGSLFFWIGTNFFLYALIGVIFGMIRR